MSATQNKDAPAPVAAPASGTTFASIASGTTFADLSIELQCLILQDVEDNWRAPVRRRMVTAQVTWVHAQARATANKLRHYHYSLNQPFVGSMTAQPRKNLLRDIKRFLYVMDCKLPFILQHPSSSRRIFMPARRDWVHTGYFVQVSDVGIMQGFDHTAVGSWQVGDRYDKIFSTPCYATSTDPPPMVSASILARHDKENVWPPAFCPALILYRM